MAKARPRRIIQREKEELLRQEAENPYFDYEALEEQSPEGALPPADDISEFSYWVNIYYGAAPVPQGIFLIHLEENFSVPIASFGAYTKRQAQRIAGIVSDFYAQDLEEDKYYLNIETKSCFDFEAGEIDDYKNPELIELIEAFKEYGEHWLNIYEITRHYGGPEEGGWWFNHYEPIATALVKLDENIEILRSILEDLYADISSGNIYSALGGADLSVSLSWRPATRYPTRRPYYE